MTDYYANLAVTYESAHAVDGGLTPATAWGGVAGAQRAIATAAAGDAIYLMNAADPSTNQTLDVLLRMVLTDTTGFAVGGEVTNQTGVGTGRVAAISTNAYILFELVTGSFTGGDTVTGDGGSTTTTAGDVTTSGLRIDPVFAADGPVTLAGVAADGVTAEAALLDGASTAPGLVLAGVDSWTVRDLLIENAAAYGVEATAAAEGWRFDNVKVYNAANHGWRNLSYLTKTIMEHFSADQCGSDGMNPPPRWSVLEMGEIVNNGSEGLRFVQSETTVLNCLVAGNGSVGVAISGDDVHLRGCVIDGNGGDGVWIETADKANITVKACRLTHNTGYGISSVDGDSTHRSDHNVYFNNASGSVSQVATGPNDHGPVGSGLACEDVTGDGYYDRVGGDYILTHTAVGRDMAVAIDAVNTVHLTAGLAAGNARRASDDKRGGKQ